LLNPSHKKIPLIPYFGRYQRANGLSNGNQALQREPFVRDAPFFLEKAGRYSNEAGFLTYGFSSDASPSHSWQGTVAYRRGQSVIQWRDRAGFAPASLLTRKQIYARRHLFETMKL